MQSMSVAFNGVLDEDQLAKLPAAMNTRPMSVSHCVPTLTCPPAGAAERRSLSLKEMGECE